MRARLVTAVLVASLAASGCSGEREPDAGPTLPPITEAPSPSPTPDAVPTEATAETSEGAAEFARLFYEQVALGFQTPDPSLVERLSTDSCSVCNDYIESIRTVQEQGWRAEGGDFEIAFAVAPAVDGPTATVDVGWDFAPVRYYDEAGTVVDEGPAVTGVEEQLTLQRSGQTWLVSDITRIRQRQ